MLSPAVTGLGLVATALCAHLMDATELWGHAPFFTYVDRWMTPLTDQQRKATRAVIGDSIERFPHGSAGSTFTRLMWQAYRGGR